MLTSAVPLTVLPEPGAVNEARSAVGGGGGVPLVSFDTVTVRVVVAVWPFAVTASVSVRAPFATVLVSQLTQSVEPVVIARLTIGAPSTESANVFGAAQSAVVDMPTDCEPLTACPAFGYVNAAVKLAVGGDATFDTVTVRVAVAVCAPFVTVSVRVWLPFAAPAVFHA
jgi:hypothetical protein